MNTSSFPIDLSLAKMHGAGNDFVVLDRRPPDPPHDARAVRFLCHRRLGVGADGALWMERLENGESAFRMHFYNNDGGRVNLCLNGARCCARRAFDLGWVRGRFAFLTERQTIDAEVTGGSVHLWIEPVRVATGPVELPAGSPGTVGYFVDTGDPHLVVEVPSDALDRLELPEVAPPLRWWQGAFADGNNVHFVARRRDEWWIRSYERGVEAETLACGSGCLSAVAALVPDPPGGAGGIALHTRAGDVITVTPGPGRWQLSGPAVTVFTSTVPWDGSDVPVL
jgi:diaminopimelate epimerase